MEIIEQILQILFYPINILLMVYGIYFFVTALFAFKKKNIIRKYKPKHKFAILIPARNETKVVVNLIDSLKKQNYPEELYEIFVIPNNCTDDTEQVAKEAGASIITCREVVKSKGDVLKEAFAYFKDNGSDISAYIVFDADNLVHKEFLSRMNDALCSGYKVAQGFRDSKNPHHTWISDCYSIYYLIQNTFFNSARMNMGWSASINGTGFMVAKEVIDEHGFKTVTMTEDIEFAALCALNNIKIAYVEDAITYDEQPLTFGQSWKQRIRWSTGTIQCLYRYAGRLVKTTLTNKVPQGMDMALFFLAPIIQILSLLIVGIFALISLFNIDVPNMVLYILQNVGAFVLVAYLTCLAVAVLVVKVQKKSIIKSFKGVFMLSIFMLSWIPINMICLYRKDHVWEPIEHNADMTIEDVS